MYSNLVASKHLTLKHPLRSVPVALATYSITSDRGTGLRLQDGCRKGLDACKFCNCKVYSIREPHAAGIGCADEPVLPLNPDFSRLPAAGYVRIDAWLESGR